MISPLGHHVLVELLPLEETRKGLIELPKDIEKAALARQPLGKVIALGNGVYSGRDYDAYSGATPEIRAEKWGYKIGDTVHFRSHTGLVAIGGDKPNLVFMVDSTIIGVEK